MTRHFIDRGLRVGDASRRERRRRFLAGVVIRAALSVLLVGFALFFAAASVPQSSPEAGVVGGLAASGALAGAVAVWLIPWPSVR